MHILLVHRYYWPDTPAYAKMLHIMAKDYVSRGHRVTVFSTQPCYNGNYLEHPAPAYEIVDGVEIFRTPLLRESKKTRIRRALNVVIFCLSLIVHCFRRIRTYDLMSVASFPPVVMGMTARFICLFSRSKYLYHCQDLYPETVVASGLLKKKWLESLSRSIDLKNCRKAVAVVVLSEDMKTTVLNRDPKLDNVHVINNFIIDQFDETVSISDDLKASSESFRVLFAGNLGRFQNLDKLMDAAHRLADQSEIQFWFVGDGALKNHLVEASGTLLNRTVFFRPFLPLKEVMVVISESQLGIVSLNPGVVYCAFPSKTMSYLESGCRLLLLVEPESELAGFVSDNELGTVCKHATAESLVDAVLSEFEQWQQGGQPARSIQQVGRENFGQNVILDKWSQLLCLIERRN
ncbi:glycosyltransferase family 4 protein [Mariniblastus fucicola]|uniref:Putative glycosyl transferase n=1 Tax=Mariniblastus fucicola TaxID=980251 RepID=A0A5B9PHH9_9BACT|nr:glycosyltransferase family 4 protein [Mariniblastus fucicola]QEG22331.1 putative glycosyl transferase [Mariniblastus fucicola]